MRAALMMLLVACGAPTEAPPLGPRPEPLKDTELPHPKKPSQERPTIDPKKVTMTHTGALMGFPADEPRADPLAARDAGVDAILPPETPLPDAGIISDAGTKL